MYHLRAGIIKPVIKVGTTVLSNPDYFTYHYASDQE